MLIKGNKKIPKIINNFHIKFRKTSNKNLCADTNT